MKKGFTLIELLIVVVVIATLMGLVFRLAGVGEDQAKRNRTITRMQKLEFALSGYYAAFGTYPPVPLHGTRDIFAPVNDVGVQIPQGSSSADGGGSQSDLNWIRVRAACLSQPVACEFPYNGKSQRVKESVDMMVGLYGYGDASLFNNAQSWSNVQLFKFGVMSFLMPRYLFMLAGPKDLYDSPSHNAQWKSQNDLSTIFNFKDGKRWFSTWETMQDYTLQRETDERTGNSQNFDNSRYRGITMEPSQAVCARWMQALDGIVSGGRTFYGVDTSLNHEKGGYYAGIGGRMNETGKAPGIYVPRNDPSDTGSGNQYILDGMTVRDGWGTDLFYYSPPPYQSYRLWSAGPNGKTVPPWIDPKDLTAQNRATASEWMADDITGLSAPAN